MIVICDPAPAERQRIAAAIGGEVEAVQAESLEQADGAVERTGEPTVVVIGPGIAQAEVFGYAEKAEYRPGRVATLLVLPTLDPQVLREALRSGVDDVLTFDASTQEWTEAISRAEARLAAEAGASGTSEPEQRRGKIVTVFSTKGGAGKSLVASNLAVIARERSGADVALVDLDLQSGDLAIMFQLMPALSIYDAAQTIERLDAEALAGYFTAHRSGIKLLAAPMEPSLAEQVSPEAVTRILSMLPDMFALTVIDCPPLFTDQTLAALDLTDEVVLLGSMDVPSIKNLRLAINTLSQLGHPRDHLRIILNRADSKVGLRTSEVEKSLGVEVDVQIPSSRDVPLSINQGTPLAVSRPKSPVVAAIAQLADGLVGAPKSGKLRRKR